MHAFHKRHRGNTLLIKYLSRDEDLSLLELEKVGRAWVAPVLMHGPCMDGDGFVTTKMTFSSLSLANAGILSLDSMTRYQCSCSCCESVSNGLHIVAKF